MSERLTAWTRGRPIKVAFIVPYGARAQKILDGVFADSYSRWGGRFSLIVPSKRGQMTDEYWAWLEAYDPDIVYSYARLSEKTVLKVHELVGPSEYREHEFQSDRDDVHAYKPTLKVDALSSVSCIFKTARRTAQELKILDVWWGQTPSRFFSDNFGTYIASFGSGIWPEESITTARLLTVVSKTPEAARGSYPYDRPTVADELAAMTAFAEKQATSMSAISSWFTRKLELRNGAWSTHFNLVVGDSFEDRLLFWNARLLIPSWLDREFCCFRVSERQLADEKFRETLVSLLKSHNHVRGGSGGQNQIMVRSVSLKEPQLEEILAAIRSTRPWGNVWANHVPSVQEFVPDKETLRESSEESSWFGTTSTLENWTEHSCTPSNCEPPLVAPEHLADVPPGHSFASGLWINEHLVQTEYPEARFDDKYLFRLPRRWRMHGAFNVLHKEHGRRVWALPSRTTRFGTLATCTSVARPVSSIEIPSGNDAIYHALSSDGMLHREMKKGGTVVPPNRVYECKPSNEDAYLNGVLGLAGGIESAQRFLLHPFLMELFAKLGGSPRAQEHDQTPTVNRLKDLAKKTPSFDISTNEGREMVMSLISKEARMMKNADRHLKYDEISQSWEKHRKSFYGKVPDDHNLTDEELLEHDEWERGSLTVALQALRERKMIFQGHAWTCSECSHRNWIDFDDLAINLGCSVCSAKSAAPIDVQWKFSANNFLIECLRDHSVLSLLWVISWFRFTSQRSLLICGPTSLLFNEASKTPDSEADLLVVSDQRTYFCEVKNSWREVTSAFINGVVSDAQRLRPDVALVAVMANGSRQRERLENAKQMLAKSDIELQILTLDKFRLTERPYL